MAAFVTEQAVREAVSSVTGWYHTLDLPYGVTTPGWFDNRPVIDRLPWPDVAGMRCLDIATWDGFFAFELERRHASEVVATDIAGHEDWDHLPGTRQGAVDFHEAAMGSKGQGFAVAASCLKSAVHKEIINVYDLSPDRVGVFDFVMCGTLLLHLRDPFRALEAIRTVCKGYFLSMEQVHVGARSLLSQQASLVLHGSEGQWAIPTIAGHRKMLEMSGFEVVMAGKPFAEPFGVAHPKPTWGASDRIRSRWLGGFGVPKVAVLTRPRGL